MIWVGQFGIEGGEAREETPWVGVYPASDHDDDAADLYVVVHPALPGSEEFLSEMKDAIGRVFQESHASLTGGILRALRTANENLRDWNRRSLKEHQVAAGVSCLAVTESEAYLAQVGPSLAVFFRNGDVEDASAAIPEAAQALGLQDEFWPEFRRYDLHSGDRLLLLSPVLWDKFTGKPLTEALALDGEEALPELYKLARGQSDCGALLVAATPEIAPGPAMKPRFFRTQAEFRAWLEKNGAESQELLVGFHKTKAAKSGMTYAQALDEALCYGWIDGVRRSLDDDSYSIRFTPRKKGSIWSNINIRHVERLKKAGLMQPAGLDAYAKRSAHKSGIYSFEQPPRELDASREKRFRVNKAAWRFWETQAPSYRRTASFWVESAKQEETRERRLATLIDDSAHHRKIALLTWEKKTKAPA